MGNSIQLSARRKRILARVRVAVSDVFDCLYEIENNLARGERPFFAENAAALVESVARFKRLRRSVVALSLHARKEAA